MPQELDVEILRKISKLTSGCRIPTLQFNSWRDIFEFFAPKRYLELGSFKGRSLFLASVLAKAYDSGQSSCVFTCIDSWEGGDEHKVSGVDMPLTESAFDEVMAICQESIAPKHARFEKIKSLSRDGLLSLQGRTRFYDFIFIDASHRAQDVLSDAILAWPLLRKGGIMVFDDYSWVPVHSSHFSILESPKLGIDSFLACYADELTLLSQMPLLQLCVLKDVFPSVGGYSIASSTRTFQELSDCGIVSQ